MSNHLLATPCGWYFRMAVPSDLKQHIGKREIKKPLHAADKKTAIKKARVLACEAEALFERLRGEVMSWRYPLYPGMTEIIVNQAIKPDGTIIKNIDMTPEEFNQLEPRAREQLLSCLTASGLFATSKPKFTVSEIIQKYCDEKNTGHHWTIKSAGEIRSSLDLLVKVLGDVPMADIDSDKASYLFWVVSLLPSNWNKKPEFRDKTADELTAKYKNLSPDEIRKNRPAGTHSAKTVNKNMDRITSFWAWSIEKEYASKQYFNRLRQKDHSIPDQDRDIFSPHHIQMLFSSEIFTELIIEKPFHYWAPLIAIYSGMRQTEIGQLYLDDLRCDEDGIWFFDINSKGAGKKLKNKFSKRMVPIHSYLLRAGLIQYRDSLQEKGQTRLFPELKYSMNNGFGDDISDWFGKYRRLVGIPEDGPVFHSFRHSVSTALMNQGVLEAITSKILGHAHKPISYGTYGKKPLQILQENIEKIDFNSALKGVIPWP